MLTTIKGTYDKRKITLIEEPPINTKANVIVTFLGPEVEIEYKREKRITLGLLTGKIKLPDDFNEPLEDLKDYM